MSLFLTCRRKPGQKSDFQVGSLSHQWWVHPQAIGTARLRLCWPERKLDSVGGQRDSQGRSPPLTVQISGWTNATAWAASVTEEFSTASQGRPPSLTADFRVQSDSSPALCGWCFVFLATTKTPLSQAAGTRCPGAVGASPRGQRPAGLQLRVAISIPQAPECSGVLPEEGDLLTRSGPPPSGTVRSSGCHYMQRKAGHLRRKMSADSRRC